MPLEIRPGSAVAIPCRHCGRSMIRFSVAEGAHLLTCAKCNSATEVKVDLEGGAWRIRTSRGGEGRPKAGR